MLLKNLFRSGSLLARTSGFEVVQIKAASSAAPATGKEERDLVNFPRVERLQDPAPVKMYMFPQSWFDAFYNQTGVTGPYMLGFGAAMFLLSKEIWVVEHELKNGVLMFLTWGLLIKKFGPAYNKWIEAEIEKDHKTLNDLRDIPLNSLSASLENHASVIDQAKHQYIVYDSKKENIGLQLEAAYRQRLVEVHNQVKKKLDFHLQTSSVKNAFEQKHMGNWIVNNVKKSITPEIEAAVLKQCFVDLKALAAKA